MADNTKSKSPADDAARPADQAPIRSGERFDGGTDEDEKAGAGFGEGDDARRARERPAPPHEETDA